MIWVNLLIWFGSLVDVDYESFVVLLKGLCGKKVLVYCEVNMCVLLFIFFYCMLVEGIDFNLVWEVVLWVWML